MAFHTKLANLNLGKDFDGISLDTSNIYLPNSYNINLHHNFIRGDNELFDIVNGWLTRFTLKNNQWTVIKKVESYGYNIEYQGKLWSMVGKENSADFDINWLDLNTFESGFIKFNVVIPDFVTYRGYSNGVITYSGLDSSTGNYVYINIDITTGEAVNKVDTPKMIFNTIVPLN